MNDVDVTVIIPTFRRPELLARAALSALSQEGVSLEVCVVDDSPEGSARDTALALSLRDGRVVYRKRPTPSNGRPAIVRNDAWPDARGRYVHFLDDDDVVMPGAYLAHVEALEANSSRWMSFGRIEPFGADPAAVQREAIFWREGAERARRAARLGQFALVATLLFDGAVLQSSACMVRKSVLREIGGFDTLMPLQEDTEMHARGTRLRGCVFIDRPVVRYCVSSTSLMRSGDTQSLLQESYARMHRKYQERYGFAEFMAMKLFVRSRSALAALGRFGRRGLPSQRGAGRQ